MGLADNTTLSENEAEEPGRAYLAGTRYRSDLVRRGDDQQPQLVAGPRDVMPQRLTLTNTWSGWRANMI